MRCKPCAEFFYFDSNYWLFHAFPSLSLAAPSSFAIRLCAAVILMLRKRRVMQSVYNVKRLIVFSSASWGLACILHNPNNISCLSIFLIFANRVYDILTASLIGSFHHHSMLVTFFAKATDSAERTIIAFTFLAIFPHPLTLPLKYATGGLAWRHDPHRRYFYTIYSFLAIAAFAHITDSSSLVSANERSLDGGHSSKM